MWATMAILASRADSMVVTKGDASFFRDDELAIVSRVYRTYTGGRGMTDRIKSVQESHSAAWILTIGMGNAGNI